MLEGLRGQTLAWLSEQAARFLKYSALRSYYIYQIRKRNKEKVAHCTLRISVRHEFRIRGLSNLFKEKFNITLGLIHSETRQLSVGSFMQNASDLFSHLYIWRQILLDQSGRPGDPWLTKNFALHPQILLQRFINV